MRFIIVVTHDKMVHFLLVYASKHSLRADCVTFSADRAQDVKLVCTCVNICTDGVQAV